MLILTSSDEVSQAKAVERDFIDQCRSTQLPNNATDAALPLSLVSDI